MISIPDHPVVRSLERTGYPPWFRAADSGKRQFPSDMEGAEEDESLHGGPPCLSGGV